MTTAHKVAMSYINKFPLSRTLDTMGLKRLETGKGYIVFRAPFTKDGTLTIDTKKNEYLDQDTHTSHKPIDFHKRLFKQTEEEVCERFLAVLDLSLRSKI